MMDPPMPSSSSADDGMIAAPQSSSPLALVRESTRRVAQSATHVRINREAAAALASPSGRLRESEVAASLRGKFFEFDDASHVIANDDALTAQLILAIDAVNFCFWPDGELEYEHVSGGLSACARRDPSALSADRLAEVTGPDLRRMMGWERPLPQEEERARLLREVGDGLRRCFGGRAASLVEAADGSASRLVDLVTSHFPGFRDHAIHDGAQVFLYKRAQIFVADLWGAFKGCGLGSFGDVDALTTFADYRVPVVLRELGVLEYDDALAAHVAAKEEILPGSAYEIEIRAW